MNGRVPANRPLRVRCSSDDAHRFAALAELLRARGHVVEVTRSPGADLGAKPDVLVVDGIMPGALQTVSRLKDRSKVVFVASGYEPETFARALNLGLRYIVASAFDPANFVETVERAARISATSPHSKALGYGRSYDLEQDEVVHAAARDLVAFLVKHGVAAPHRIRIASAAAELVSNARRHAYGSGTDEVARTVLIEAECVREQVRVNVSDRGVGIDQATANLECVPAALPRPKGSARADTPGGLARARALADGFRVQRMDPGTRVELGFVLAPVSFDEESDRFGEIDFLAPAALRDLAHSVASGRDLPDASPSLTLTIGRLLQGPLPPESDPSARRPS